MGWELRGKVQPQVLPSVSVLWLGKHPLNKISVILAAIAISVDYLQKRPLAYKLSEGRLYLLYAGIFSAAMIGIAVIFLFVAQLNMVSMNMTTIESFVNGMSIRVGLQQLSNPSGSQPSAKTCSR